MEEIPTGEVVLGFANADPSVDLKAKLHQKIQELREQRKYTEKDEDKSTKKKKK